MTVADVDAAVKLDAKCFGTNDAWSRADFFDMATSDDTECFVAECDGKIIACAGAEIFYDVAEIDSLAVDPDFRRQGIGTLIFVKLLSAIKLRGVMFVMLEVRLSNATAIELYKKFGFRVVDRQKNFYGDEDALIMAREL